MTYTRTISDTIDALHTGQRVYKDCLYGAIAQADSAFNRKLAEAVRALEEQHEAEERLHQARMDAMTWDEFIGK